MEKSPRARVAAVFADVLASLQLDKDRVVLLGVGIADKADKDDALTAALATVKDSFDDLLANVIAVMNNIASGNEPDAGLEETPKTPAGSQETRVQDEVIDVMCEPEEDAGGAEVPLAGGGSPSLVDAHQDPIPEHLTKLPHGD